MWAWRGRLLRKYPHEFSGGQRQRIGIARALASRARARGGRRTGLRAGCDSIQAQILELMSDLGKEYGLTRLFISHDLAVVRHIADRILVLYQGRLVEQGSANDLFENPREDYTRRLLQSIPGRSLLI